MASILLAFLSVSALHSATYSINLGDISYMSEPSSYECNAASFAEVVHSAPSNVHLRDAIRDTWGSAAGSYRIFGREQEKLGKGVNFNNMARH